LLAKEMKMNMTMTRSIRALLVGGALVVTLPGVAQADGYWRHGEIHRFHDHDLGRWQRGYWHHGHHLGRHGWWWVVGGTWYFYSEPIYPYPDPYTPPVVVLAPQSAPAPAPAPVVSQPIIAPPPVQYWYYCDASKAYYPYVATCPGGWRPVAATPTP
jgi:hypothetical protein